MQINAHLDEEIVQGMTHLSFEELQREQEELHGVSAIVRKEKEELDTLLEVFRFHCNRLKRGTAYEYAESVDKNYVCNKTFQLMFIRSNRYEPKASAKQAIRFFDMKKKLFGKDKLVEDITLNDLDDDDKASLMAGSFQLLKSPDSSGRRILLEVPGLSTWRLLENQLRALFYIFMHLAKSEDTIGTPGPVFLSYCIGEFRDKTNGAGFVESTRLALACPIHWSGLHLACDDRTDAILSRASIAIMPAQMRAKTKLHFGSHVECQYLLSTFGIKRESLPLAPSTDAMILTGHLEWYHHCLMRENTCDSPDQEYHPASNDVFFAGRRINGDGNVRLRSMALQNAQSYNSGNPKERRFIVDSMVDSIKGNGGRFLKLDIDGSSWIEVSVPGVREKIVQMFRNFRRPRASQQKAIQSESNPMPLNIVDIMHANDVLFGRQKGHEGNRKLRHLVDNKAAEYDAATRGRKKEIVEELVAAIQQPGSRFLKRTQDGRYEVVSYETASMKVASHFRNHRRIKRERNK